MNAELNSTNALSSSHEGGNFTTEASETQALVPTPQQQQGNQQTATLFIMKKIWVWVLAVFLDFVVTLAIFPSVAAMIDSTEKGKVKNV